MYPLSDTKSMQIYFPTVLFQGKPIVFEYNIKKDSLTIKRPLLLSDGTKVVMENDEFSQLLSSINFPTSHLSRTNFEFDSDKACHICKDFQQLKSQLRLVHENYRPSTNSPYTSRKAIQSKTSKLRQMHSETTRPEFILRFNMESRQEKFLNATTMTLEKILSFEEDPQIWRKTYVWHPSRRQIENVEEYRLNQRASSPALTEYSVIEQLTKERFLNIKRSLGTQIIHIEKKILPIISQHYQQRCKKGVDLGQSCHQALIMHLRLAIAKIMNPQDYDLEAEQAAEVITKYEGNEPILMELFLAVKQEANYLSAIEDLKTLCIEHKTLKQGLVEQRQITKERLELLSTGNTEDTADIRDKFTKLNSIDLTHSYPEIDKFFRHQFLQAIHFVFNEAKDKANRFDQAINDIDKEIKELESTLQIPSAGVTTINKKEHLVRVSSYQSMKEHYQVQQQETVPYHQYLPRIFLDAPEELYIPTTQKAIISKAFLMLSTKHSSPSALKKLNTLCQKDRVPAETSEEIRQACIQCIKSDIEQTHASLNPNTNITPSAKR